MFMFNALKIDSRIVQLIQLALQEDLKDTGDPTSNFLIDRSKIGKAAIIAKQPGIIAGLPVAEQVFRLIDPKTFCKRLVEEGAAIESRNRILQISGSIQGILAAERTALNFLQRLSGIATLTAKFVEQVKGTNAKILDTRKTTPGLRALEKYAVRVGGGKNHRMGLFDMILIKENHIAAVGGIREAVIKVKKEMEAQNLNLKIEVETRNLDELNEALELAVDRVMLDNMNISQIKKAVQLVRGRLQLEVSGGVTLKNVREIAETGVDYISIGALTHSAPALDLSVLLE
jgi:nicotinate-nucleotide pyrophosphorylase (carboxylating)